MKFKIALIAALAVGLMASFAVAAPAKGPKGKAGNTNTTTTSKVKKAKKVCRPNVSLILKGTLVSVADDQLSFTMDVKQTNKHAKALYKGKTVSVQVNAKTKIKRLGKRVTLSELTIGDRLNVQARLCKVKKGTVVVEAAPPLAVRVVARPAKPAPTTTTDS